VNQIVDLLDLSKRMDQKKAPWLEYWQQLGDIFLPNQADFTRAKREARARTDIIYDGTPRIAARGLATTIEGLLKPKTARWFNVTLNDPEIAEIDEVKLWLETVADRMWQAIYRPAARYIQNSAEATENLIVFGNGPLFIGENSRKTGLQFRAFHMRQCGWMTNADGVVDRFKIDEDLTARQAIGRWGEEKLHPKVLEAANDPKKADEEFCFTQMILPRDDYDAKRLDERGMAFKSCVIDVKNEHKVTDEGFHEFPVGIRRWETAPGEVYARGPAMMALPDAKTLQAMGKTLLIAGQKAVDPPTWAYNDAVLSPIRTFPGGHISLDATAASQIGSGAPIGVLDMGKNMPLGLEMQNATREMVKAAFFENVFNLPIEGRQMTATEILERKETFLRTIGPVLGRLETDDLGHTAERVFNIMYRAGQFPDFPDIGDVEVKIEFQYMSPVQKARKETELASLGRTFEILGPLIEIDPSVADNIDGDQIARDLPEAGAFPQKWLRTRSDVEEKRAQRAQQAEAQMAIDAAKPVAGAIKDITAAGMAATGGAGGAPAAL
jgi:hypothetical protein